jgi:hypothetical protein
MLRNHSKLLDIKNYRQSDFKALTAGKKKASRNYPLALVLTNPMLSERSSTPEFRGRNNNWYCCCFSA